MDARSGGLEGVGSLIVNRKLGDIILIGDEVRITVIKVQGLSRLSLRIEAPRRVAIKTISASKCY